MNKPDIHVSFKYDKVARKWEATVFGCDSALEAKQAFNAVLETCRPIEASLFHQADKIMTNPGIYKIVPAIKIKG